MESLLFSDRSLWTMLHGIVLGGGSLLMLFAALFALRTMRTDDLALVATRPARSLVWLLLAATAALWLTTLIGTYVSFPPYRAVPPEGLTDLAQHPKALIQANPATAWLHSFAMEVKEHVPWIAAMLTSGVAAAGTHSPDRLLGDRAYNRIASVLIGIAFVLVAFVAVLGTFVNKVAPLE